MENRFYVYAHFIPNQEVPFYIGKGTADRAYQKWNRNPWWKRIVNKYGLEIKLLEEGLTHKQANELEIKLIAQFGRKDIKTGCLVNLTDGGEGFVGMLVTDSHKKHNSQALKLLGEKHPAKRESWKKYMREHNPAKKDSVRKKISENNSMNNPATRSKLVGRKHTIESRTQISEANRKRVRTEESKERVRQSLLRYHQTKKTKENI